MNVWERRELRKQEKLELIVRLADAMIYYDWRILDLESNFRIPKSTVHRYITSYLKYVDDDKFVQCRHILDRHKRNHRKRGGRY